MKCLTCNKVVPITKAIQAQNDSVVCQYCQRVIPSELIIWSDGEFHFSVYGDVTASACDIKPRKLMHNQTAKVFDVRVLRDKAINYIRTYPNLNCICSEFMIKNSDIRVELELELPDEEEIKV